jgi:hypothetical protein
MPPASPIPNPNEDRLLPPAHTSSAGPIIGIVIIVVLMIFGALYFWGAQLNQEPQNPPAYIPPDPSDASTTDI